MADKTIVVAVNLDTKQATSNAAELNGEIAKLRATTSELKKEQTQLARSGQENSERYKELSNEIALNDAMIKKLSADYSRQTKILQANAGSIEELRAITGAMTKQADQFRVGIDGTADDLANLQKQVKANIENIRAFDLAQGKAQANVGNYEESIKNAIRAMKDEGVTLVQLKTQYQQLGEILQDSNAEQAGEINKTRMALQQQIGFMEGRLDEFGDRVAKGNKEISNTFADVGQGIVAAFSVAPLVTFDEENQTAAELAAHAQAAIAMAANAKAIAVAAASVADAKEFAIEKALNVQRVISNTYLKLQTALTFGQTAATEGATFATRALSFAMKSLPILAIIGGLAALIGTIKFFIDANNQAVMSEKALIDIMLRNIEIAKEVDDQYKAQQDTRLKLMQAEGKAESELAKQRLANLEENERARQRHLQDGAAAIDRINKKLNSDISQDEKDSYQQKLEQATEYYQGLVNEGRLYQDEHKIAQLEITNAEKKEAAEREKNAADEAAKKKAIQEKYRDDILKLRAELDKADVDATADEFERQKRAAALEFNQARTELTSRIARTQEEQNLINALIETKRKELKARLAEIEKNAEDEANKKALENAEKREQNLAKALENTNEIAVREQAEANRDIDQLLLDGTISKEKAEELKLQAQLDSLEKQKINAEVFGQDTLALEQEILDTRLAMQQQLTDKKKKDADDEAARRKEELEASIAAAQEAVGIISQIYQNRLAGELQATEDKQAKEIENLEKLRAKQGLTEEQFNARKAAIDEKYAKQAADIKRKQFIADKRAAEIETIINTAVSISKVLYNPLLVGLAAGIGALQLAAIESQPIPTFARGGFTGPGIMAPDSTGERPAGIVHAGEYVVPRGVLSNPLGANLVSQLEAMRGHAYPGYANGGLVAQAAADATFDYDRLAEAIARNVPTTIKVDDIATGLNRRDAFIDERNI